MDVSGRHDLTGLEALRVVQGALSIEAQADGSGLQSLRGLDHLRCIGSDLVLGRVSTLEGLTALVEVGGSVEIAEPRRPAGARIPALQRVWGDVRVPAALRLPALETVYGRFQLQPRAAGAGATPRLSYIGCHPGHEPCRDGVLGCDYIATTQADVTRLATCEHARSELRLDGAEIEDLTPLARLQSVAGDFTLGPERGAGSLVSLAGLERLQRVGASLRVQNLPELADLQGLSALELAQHVEIKACAALTDLTGLTALRTVQGRLQLDRNASLRSLHGAPQLTALRELVLAGNASLPDLQGFPSQLGRLLALTIEHNASLRTLEGAESLTHVQSVFVSDNPQLTELARFRNLRSLRELEVADNPRLESLGAFPVLDGDAEPDLVLRNNARLESLRGLERVTRAYNVSLSGNAALRGLADWNIERISNLLVVSNNAALTSLSGLERLKEAAYVRIQANPQLTDVSALSGLRSASTVLELRSNRSLAEVHELQTFARARLHLENNAL
jgi:hypothetical protein